MKETEKRRNISHKIANSSDPQTIHRQQFTLKTLELAEFGVGVNLFLIDVNIVQIPSHTTFLNLSQILSVMIF